MLTRFRLNDNGLEKIKSIAAEVTDKLELVLVDVKLTAQGKRRVLLVTIHRRGSRINLDDCEKASRALEQRLDELASGPEATPLASGYDLEVESPGIDRTLKTVGELAIFTGELVEVKLKERHESLGQAFTGELAGHADGVTRIVNPQPLAVAASKKAKQLAKNAPPPPPEVAVKDGSYISIKLYPNLSKRLK